MRSASKEKVPGIDEEFDLHDLTDRFFAFYNYHNNDCLIATEQLYVAGNEVNNNGIVVTNHEVSRFDTFRLIEAGILGKRPGNSAMSATRPRVSFGYNSQVLDYASVPYKAVFFDSDTVDIKLDRKLRDLDVLTPQEKQAQEQQALSAPSTANNTEISQDTTKAFNILIQTSSAFKKANSVISQRVEQDGAVAILHQPDDFRIEAVKMIDLVFEPQAEWDTDTWSIFFVIRKMTAAEILKIIRSDKDEYAHWTKPALEWALKAEQSDNLINYNHYKYGNTVGGSNDKITSESTNENFAVRSHMVDSNNKVIPINSYYGNLLVAEAYYINNKGTVTREIFLPSQKFQGINADDRAARKKMTSEQKIEAGIANAGTLFRQTLPTYTSLKRVLTTIVVDRAETSLERQRGLMHELHGPLEMLGRIDSAILNAAILMGVPFIKNQGTSTTGQDLLDLEINVSAELVDLGFREFAEAPFQIDLVAMMNVRNMILTHTMSKMFLGGLDGTENLGNNSAGMLAELRIGRDHRVIKSKLEDYGQGLTESYSKVLANILELMSEEIDVPADVKKEAEGQTGLSMVDKLIKYKFSNYLLQLKGYAKEMFQYDPDEVLDDTCLPYWIDLSALRNGSSGFGLGEMLEIKTVLGMLGDMLSQDERALIKRRAIKAITSSSFADDLLGDPNANIVRQEEQLYTANLENSDIIASADTDFNTFFPVGVLSEAHDHMLHLTQSHLPLADQLKESLDTNQVESNRAQDLSEEELITKNKQILRLNAAAAHIKLHDEHLIRIFGNNNAAVNEVRERNNNIIQSAEGYLRVMEDNIISLQTKRRDRLAALDAQTPETQLEREKIELEREKLQRADARADKELQLAYRIAGNEEKKALQDFSTKREAIIQKDRDSQRKAQTGFAQVRANLQSDTTKATIENKKVEVDKFREKEGGRQAAG